ncbi:Mitogen-activated protein kinase-binding protein 1 [Papilio machaon]|uniref:Mitogen-activated protein kinase-binding protein 1 n=1 Tax=Papilio machaon TaxID=76193 RepID=A0A194RIF0_PAPMA|nr:Mitogen-activated protein kinase-binding protein 1 [Papilio machaon]
MAFIGPRNSAPVIRDSLHTPAYEIKLETVFGLTVSSNAALDCDPNTEVVAYPAGCTVVLYNVRKNRQSHVLNASRKSVTCVAFSPDGRYLATGECGHAPAVRVWDLQDPSASGAVQIAEFPGHTHGVNCVAFSTSSKYLVSVGSQHDMIVNVWDWRANLKLASNKVSSRVKAVSFSESGNYFVTVGFRHVKFWYLEYSRNAKFKEPVPLMGRSAILGEQKDNEFCDVVCGRGEAADSTYAITRGGLLCEFNSRRLLDKWVELRTTSANCMAIGANYIFVGCAEGIVRCFAPDSLRYVTTLPRTHYLGVDVAQGVNINHMFTQPGNARYPDAIALTYDERNHKLTCVYNDHSLYVWDVRDIKRVGKSHSALYHSACIWGVDMVCGGVSGELNKIVYIDPELKFLKDVDLTATSDRDKSKSYDDKIGVRCVRVSPCGRHIAAGDRAGNVWIHSAEGAPLHTLEAHDAEVLCLEYSAKPRLLASASRDRLVHVFLCVRVSPCGRHIAAGDRAGNVWIHSAEGAPLHTLEAHDAEVLCLEYSAKPRLLASASRDRLVHVFLVDRGYQILQTLDEHSSSITAVRFLSSSAGLQMVSCGADKTILFRQLKTTQDGSYQFARGQNVSGRTTLYDMEVDAGGRHILTACQDRNVRVYSAAHGRHTKTFRGTTAEDGTLIKVIKKRCVFMKKVPVGSNGASGLDSETDSQLGSPPRDLPDTTKFGTPVVADYTLRIGKLPSWAKKSLGDELTAPGGGAAAATPTATPPAPPARGKWATRIQPANEKRVDSDGSKDSSLDSGTDTRYIEKRRDQNVKQRPKSLNLSQLPRVEALFRHFDATMKATCDILTISPRVEKVTLNLSKSRADGRTRHHTDDSSLGSFKYEDQESTEHDGDVEDISDGERTSSSESRNRPTYYPGNNDDETPGEFMVNAMDAEELRQSVRRSKRWRAQSPRLDLPPAASLSGSGHDSDDDEVSTPSGDNADRNPLSGSCESIDTAGRREKYLKSAFDSLSGVELDSTLTGGDAHKLDCNNSLSAQHLSRTPAARPDPEAARRREELQRRILETRRQLENVAFRSNLKSSQSTTDLSYIPEKDNSRRNRPVSMAVPNNSRPYGVSNLPFYPEENLDSLNFFDSLNPYQNMNLDYRNKNPYAIPANLNHRMMPEYFENLAPYVPPHSAITQNQPDKRNINYVPYSKKPVVFKEQLPQKQPLAFTIDIGKKPIQSKVFNRLFPVNPHEDKETPPKVPPRNFHLNLTEKPQPKLPKPNSRSIFKNYKSCPVSPVSEECKWADKVVQNNQNQANVKPQNAPPDPKKRNSLSFFVGLDNRAKESRKSIVDTIKSDTEKMIAEITRKYGDLDEYEPNNQGDLDLQPSKEVVEKDDGNFSSDSLEDCSLSQDVSCKNKLYSKKICKKHTKAKGMPRRAVSNYEIYGGTMEKPVVPVKPSCISQKSSTLPRNMPSNIDDVMDENYPINYKYSMYRCQSVLTKRCITRSNESVLSDNSNCSSVSNEIFLKYGNEVAFQQAKYDSRYNLNDSQNCSFENLNEPDDQYLEKHRHSSASFFLNQKKYMKTSCSQESMLSDEMYLDNEIQLSRTNCNSLESVLSDDSECTKSAPLEMLFEGARTSRQPSHPAVGMPNSKSCYEFDNSSKSYGSSPNNVSYMGGYMYNNYLGESSSNYRDIVVSPKPPTSKVYGFDVPSGEYSGHKTVTRSKSLYDSTSKQTPASAKSVAYYFDGNNIQQYDKEKKGTDEIPRLNTGDYMANTSKSLQPKFPEKHKYKSEMDGCEQNTMTKSKSCSFEVVLEPASKPNPLKNLMEKRNSHVQKNLEKFEEQIRKNIQTKVNKNQLNKEKANAAKYNNTTKSLERGSGPKNNNVKITMEFVPHKPPKPIKRTSSTKMNNRLKAGLDKSTLSSSISSQYKAKLDGLQNKNYNCNKKQEDANSNKVDSDSAEKSFDVFVKERDVNENKSEMQMDSLEVFAIQRMERLQHVSMDSLDVIDDSQNEFSKDSLDYYSEQDKKKSFIRTCKNQMNRKNSSRVDCEGPSHSRQNIEAKENIAPPDTSDEVKKYKYIERKLEIINKLVEMEERKILQEKILKEWRMRPLKANINDGKGVVKLLSRKFEKLATKQNTVSDFTSLTLEEADTDTDTASENKEIKRNLSLPDILDSDQIGGLVTVDIEVSNDAGNDAVEIDHPEPTQLNNAVCSELKAIQKSLPQRVYNEMVIPKTDVHLDSENYESSTTSSSCTNSPKRLSMYGFHRPKTPLRKVFRMPGPRCNTENQMCTPECKVRPTLGSGGAVRNSGLSKKFPFQPPVLPSKFSPVQASRTHLSPPEREEEAGGMRRAISLSDLAKPVPAPRTPQAPVKSTPPTSANSSKSPSGFVRPAPRYNSKSNMTRSSSVGVLNQSDSESDPQPSRQAASRVQGLMRPTISSMNKATANTARRRGLVNSYSTASVSTVAREESSSEAEDRGTSEPPVAAPRPRAASADRAQRRLVGRSGSERDLSAKAREVTTRLTTNTRQRSKPEPPPENNCLEAAILETQKVLRGAVLRAQNGEAPSSLSSTDGDCRALNVDSTRQKLENLVSKEASAAGNPAMSLIEQYSDILLNMMQSKMVNQFSQSPQSLPPASREPGADS